MSRAYDKWYHSKGERIQEELETFFSEVPNCISIRDDLGICDLEEFIHRKLFDEYESDMGDIEDQKYQTYKERDM